MNEGEAALAAVSNLVMAIGHAYLANGRAEELRTLLDMYDAMNRETVSPEAMRAKLRETPDALREVLKQMPR
jgi:hypothetical protein